ncbi:hypothetical protein ACEWY4_014104 [Coilia grayii]|uniref:Cadherin domain-containing protein n=1 Tax=Coilia grayii TaxID=363190 RepID=A0ABD1JRH2_9TELE
MAIRTLLLLTGLAIVAVSEGAGRRTHFTWRRQKREWIISPKLLTENEDHTQLPYVAKIRSDRDDNIPVYYYIKGPGADEDPVNLFIVNKDGLITVTGILDREKHAYYNMTGYASFTNGTLAESAIAVTIKVEDQNDNAPLFPDLLPASVYENSPAGEFVTQVHASDADEPGTAHVSLAYSVIKQEPKDGEMRFYADKTSGKIHVKSTLDRERTSSYKLTVQAVDMGGQPGGLTGTATMRVDVLDVNDIKPKLEKDEFSVSIDENVADVEVMRFLVFDDDLKGTDNNRAQFDIVSGNEDNYFSIHTDPRTNEGVLMLMKHPRGPRRRDGQVEVEEEEEVEEEGEEEEVEEEEEEVEEEGEEEEVEEEEGEGLEHQEVQEVLVDQEVLADLEVVEEEEEEEVVVVVELLADQEDQEVQDDQEVVVVDIPDGPVYRPSTKPFSIPEGTDQLSIPKVIGSFPATDGDTGKQANNVRYAKGYDPGNWLSIDEETSEITLAKMPDHESPYVVNGTYVAKILCMTDGMPTQTATGTIALNVEDTNDNCPRLTSHVQYLCSDITKVVNVTAEDLDAHPNGPPLQFDLLEESQGMKWRLQKTGDSSASLWAEEDLWPGHYEVTLEIRDKQGLACPDKQVLRLEVCTCAEGGTSCAPVAGEKLGLSSKKASQLGGAAVGVILGAFLLLLLIPLLLILMCSCGGGLAGGFTELPFDTKTHLISYHTECKGEDREVPLLSLPVQLISKQAPVTAAALSNMAAVTMATKQTQGSTFGGFNYDYEERETVDGGWMEVGAHTEVLSHLQEMREQEQQLCFLALPDTLLDNYFSQKAEHTAVSAIQRDSMLVYEYEGHGSPAGSVGCCSDFGDGDDLQFLNDLGSKFSTLAQICGYSKDTHSESGEITPPTAEVEASVVMASSVTQQTRESSCSSISHYEAPPVRLESSVSFVEVHSPTAPPSRTISTSATLPRMQLHETVGVPTQTVLLQQQPLFYMVEPQVQSTVLLADRPPVGLGQGVILVNGSQVPTDGVLMQGGGMVQGGRLVQGAQGVMVSQGGRLQGPQGVILQGSVPGQATLGRGESLVVSQAGHEQVAQGWVLSQTGNIQGTQGMMVTEGGHIQGSRGVLFQGSSPDHTIKGRRESLVASEGGHIQTAKATVTQNGQWAAGSPQSPGLLVSGSRQAEELVQGGQMVMVQGYQQHSHGSAGALLINGGPAVGLGSPLAGQLRQTANTCGFPVLLVDGGAVEQGGAVWMNTVEKASTNNHKGQEDGGQVRHGGQVSAEEQSIHGYPILQGDGHIRKESSGSTGCMNGTLPAKRVAMVQGDH